MADNGGVLSSASALTVGTTTVYTCPAGHFAKVKIMGRWQGGVNTTLDILVNGMTVASIAAMTTSHYTFTNGGAGLLRASGANAPTGASAAETVQPGPASNTYFLSAGDTIQYVVGTANMLAAQCDVVGVEVEL
jgi:hypothetical protein